jgi:hypothetical protein
MTEWQNKVRPGTNKAGEIGAVILVTDEGADPKWAYVFVKPNNIQAFYNASTQSNFVPTEHGGEIMQTGSGKTPPQTVIDEMAKLGMDSSLQKQMEASLRQMLQV